MTFRFYIERFVLLATGLSFFSCTSPEDEAQVFALNTINAFYHGDLADVKEKVDSTGAGLLDIVFPEDTLIFQNQYRVNSVSAKPVSAENRTLASVARESRGISDTITLTVRPTDNGYKAEVDEATLREWLKFEPRICTKAGEYFLEQRHDKTTAVQWLTLASMQGEPEAKYRLGLLYRFNLDFSEAIRLFGEAYARGYAKASIELASTYAMSGDRDVGIRILKQEAAKNNTDAMVALGQYYDTPSPPTDATPNSAFDWYKKQR
jgi:TPR repeat protein